MTTFNTTKWYRYLPGGFDECRPLVPEPDVSGFIAVVDRFGHYGLVVAASHTLIPERPTVEWRLAKKGERCIFERGKIYVALSDHTEFQWVIVDDEVTT